MGNFGKGYLGNFLDFLKFLVWAHEFQFLERFFRLFRVLFHSKQQVVLLGSPLCFYSIVGVWAVFFRLRSRFIFNCVLLLVTIFYCFIKGQDQKFVSQVWAYRPAGEISVSSFCHSVSLTKLSTRGTCGLYLRNTMKKLCYFCANNVVIIR